MTPRTQLERALQRLADEGGSGGNAPDVDPEAPVARFGSAW